MDKSLLENPIVGKYSKELTKMVKGKEWGHLNGATEPSMKESSLAINKMELARIYGRMGESILASGRKDQFMELASSFGPTISLILENIAMMSKKGSE